MLLNTNSNQHRCASKVPCTTSFISAFPPPFTNWIVPRILFWDLVLIEQNIPCSCFLFVHINLILYRNLFKHFLIFGPKLFPFSSYKQRCNEHFVYATLTSLCRHLCRTFSWKGGVVSFDLMNSRSYSRHLTHLKFNYFSSSFSSFSASLFSTLLSLVKVSP